MNDDMHVDAVRNGGSCDDCLSHSQPGGLVHDESSDGRRATPDSLRQSRAAKHSPVALGNVQSIVVASTFTGDSLLHPLKFWMETLSIPAVATVAPYAQVMQELLDPKSLSSQNKAGFNILLIRMEDWIRDRIAEEVEQNREHLHRAAEEFRDAMGVLRARTSASILVFFAPSSSTLPIAYAHEIEAIQSQLVAELSGLARVNLWTHGDLTHLYPISEHEDMRADRLGHIPYTTEYFAAIGTLMARRITALLKPQYKVIAIDCDNTLWKGVCGEDGAHGVAITPARAAFQKMLVLQQGAGMLLCLCSKNNQSDVDAVFETRSDMALRDEHLVCSRVNWESKSSNLKSLAEELGLSLESLIFVDDSPLECAEVQKNCPSVLTLQFPHAEADIHHFVNHVWAFDRIGVTEEGKGRTEKYKQNRARSKALEEMGDLEKFLTSLRLEVDVSVMEPGQLIRVAELVQRTNQFNLTAIRRSAGEIEALSKSGGIQVLVVHVRDRFGDYGLVGSLFLRNTQSSIEVDTFVLSCRVLGRGVEHRIVSELGRMAGQNGRKSIVLKYRRTMRNDPARIFIENSFAEFRERADEKDESAEENTFVIPVGYAAELGLDSAPRQSIEELDETPRDIGVLEPRSATGWHEAALRLSRLSDIVREMAQSASKALPRNGDYVAPRTPFETAVAEIWCDVLGIEMVGINEEFFDIGGDSLAAVRMIARVGSVLGLELPLEEFFEGATVERVAKKLAGISQINVPILRADSDDPIPLSSAQQRLWFIDQMEGGSAAYHIGIAERMRGELDRSTLKWALGHMVARHESLRTVFRRLDGEPVQEITREKHFVLEEVDLRAVSAKEREAVLSARLSDEAAKPFDLSTGPVIRGSLFQLSEDEHVLLIVMHHIISDGWSIEVLLRELGVLYGARHDGSPDSLPHLPIQYADYARWQRQWLNGADAQRALEYWREHLQGAPELLELPTDRPRPAVQSYRGESVRFSLGTELTEELKRLSKRINVTMAMMLYTAWAIVLTRISGQEDIVVGFPVANRRRTEVEGLIGVFVNTLAVRVQLDGDPCVADLLQAVKQIMLRSYAHQDVPFDQVVEVLQPTRSLSHSPIFQAMFVLHPASQGVTRLPGLTLMQQDVPQHTAQFDLLLALQDSANGLTGSLNYASDLFDDSSIERWIGCLKAVLRGMAREPQLQVSRLPLLDEHEQYRVTRLFNASQAEYAQDKLIHELFEEQVERAPDAIAVIFEGQSLTYGELNARANQLARHLREKQIGPDQLVGICVERSLEMVVGLLGILKAGGAYVPLDPSYPVERLEYMLMDAAPRVLLTLERLKRELPDTGADVIALDADWNRIAEEATSNLDPRELGLRSHHLAYMIYTSGSTGKPKGAMNEHAALINRLQWMQNQYRLSESDRVLQKTPFSFDVSVWEFFWTLMSGARLVLARPQGHQDPAYLRKVIEQTGITTLHFVPSMLQAFLEQYQAESCATIRRVICSGEELPPALQNRCIESLPRARLSNLYGPTEAAIDVTAWECELDRSGHRVPIGRPISNIQMYVLDRHGQPVPIGVAGEIFIGGAGVGRGYFNRPELTAERFLPDPFSGDPAARLYKTGDQGRWRMDGAIEYLGRNDHQVKIRGFRIELGEIEARLISHGQVQEAVVIAREDVPGEKRLVAYVVAGDGAEKPSVEEFRAHLRPVLPEYMVPSAFVTLEHMPLSPNGKLDRRALPAPELGAYGSRQYEAPRGEVEEILAGIWQGLLRVEQVGRQHNFFELGGHSLLIMQMLERLRRVGLWAEVRTVFETPVLADLAHKLTNEAVGTFEVPPSLIQENCVAITPQMLPLVDLTADQIELIVQSVPGGASNVQDIYPLAPLQEGILFHSLLNDQGGDTYILPLVLSVSSRDRVQDLVAALQSVIVRHDILRTAILWKNLPRPVQVVYRHANLPVEEVALQPDVDPEEQIKEWLKPVRQRLNLDQAPLLRMQIAQNALSRECYVMLQLHHMTIDHVTLEIVTSEVVAHLEGRAQQLPVSALYRNHVAQALAYAETHDAEAFFRRKLADVNEPTAPFGMLDVHGDGAQIEEGRENLHPELARSIRCEARRLAVSAATIFHAAWGLVIAYTSGRDDVVFGSVLLGRLQGNETAHQILGMFINTLPLRLKLERITAKELVEHTQRELIELLSHEQASLAVAQRCSGVVGSAPVFTALLNYRHSVPNPEADWAGASGIQLLAIQERTNYPISLSVDDLGDEFALTAQTDRRIEPLRLTAYLRTALESLVTALEQAPQGPALALSVLPESERREVLESFNATQTAYPQEKLLHQLVEEQVRRSPDAVAVICGCKSLTYAQLNERANQLAHALLEHGVRPDERVAIYLERSIELVVALLATLKAGGAYLPLDVSYPAERLNYMLKDGAPVVLLTQKQLLLRVSVEDVVVLMVDEDSISCRPLDNLESERLALQSRHLAYVIYTSGSTGAPKGVMVEHRNVVNLIHWHCATFDLREGSRTSCVAAIGFDAASWEIWPALAIGATLALASSEVICDPEALLEWWEKQQLDVSFLPTPLAELAFSRGINNPRLRTLLVGGDRLNRRPVAPSFALINNYGPTETTVVATSGRIQDAQAVLHIGRPIANTQIYILDSNRRPVPIGATGELYIAGAGMARGYLNRPELELQQFVADPFSKDAHARMYRSGDLARWRRDGTVEFLGRNDEQVKIRGYRIELGEIQAQIARHKDVSEAIVVAREDVPGVKRLVAYVTRREGQQPNIERLRAHLQGVLPEYMVPSAFVVLASLPLTSNGKLDRRALPAPELDSYASQHYAAPQGEAEQALADIWQDLLSVERVGRYDNFFELGGHSLLAVMSVFRINQSLGCTLKVTDIYKTPVMRDLAKRATGSTADDEIVDLVREAALGEEIAALPGHRNVTATAVLLTGGTGFVGRFLLAQLLSDTDATIYCLVRGTSKRQASLRLRASLSMWDLWRDEFESRIVAIPGDLRLPWLGIEAATYKNLCGCIDSIYHCATSMNHLETYAMAKAANVDASKELVRFATRAKPKLINYISTLGVFGVSAAGTTRVVDEQTSIDYETHRSSQGYVASKWVGEKVFLNASERGVPCNIFRLGLMWADTEQGRYDELQHGYRMLKSSFLRGYGIENYGFEMVPTPVDYAARAVVHLGIRRSGGHGIFHISSARQTVDGVFERCNEVAGTSLELKPLYEWICEVRRLHYAGTSLPVVPLVEYAFSMDEKSFHAHLHAVRSASVRFNCDTTYKELEAAGIVAPVFNDDVLKACVQSMCARDVELRELFECEGDLLFSRTFEGSERSYGRGPCN